ncbi:hypothetical protein [Streptomyces sp. NBC_01546]|uniref:hypothetical protein n=1 Tax=Streptomyces sp. NBC_01546 TaxID=2975872 RepID=UPI0038637B02
MLYTRSAALTGAFLLAVSILTGCTSSPDARPAAASPTSAASSSSPIPITPGPATSDPAKAAPNPQAGFVDCWDHTTSGTANDGSGITLTGIECWHGQGFVKVTARAGTPGPGGIDGQGIVTITYTQQGRRCTGRNLVTNMTEIGRTDGDKTRMSTDIVRAVAGSGCPGTADPDPGTKVAVIEAHMATAQDLAEALHPQH